MALKYKWYKIEMEFLTEILGTVSKNRDMYTYHAQTKARQEAEKHDVGLTDEQLARELETIKEQFIEEKGWTGFHWYNNVPVLWDYTFRGYMKEAIQGCKRFTGSLSSGLAAHKKIIDQGVFVYPMLVPLIHPDMPDSPETMATLSRALRGQTAQGERVTLVKSDAMPPGTRCEIEVWVGAKKVTEALLKEIFEEYGPMKGMGQWRSGGKGKMECKVAQLDEPQYDPLNLPVVFPVSALV